MYGLFREIVKQNPDTLETKISGLEKHHPALYLKDTSSPDIAKEAFLSKGEIGHVHEELSLHLYFSAADAKEIIDKGWAERHPLAQRKPWGYPSRGEYPFGLGSTFLLVYGPRDFIELQVLKMMLRASARYMTGRQEVDFR